MCAILALELRAQSMLDEIPLQNNAAVSSAVGLLKAGAVYDAIRLLRRKESAEPGVSKVLTLAYYLAGQHILFESRARRLMQEQPDDYAPWYYLGRHLYSDIEDYQKAAEMFRESLRRKPAHVRSTAFLGAALARLQQTQKAAELLRHALDQDPGLWFAHMELARIALAEQNYKEAEAHAESVIALTKSHAEAYRMLARIRSGQGDDKAAAPLLETAAALEPEDPVVFYQLFQVLRRIGETSRANIALQTYQRLSRN